MGASFAVGAKKVETGTEPRFLVVYGSEVLLRKKIIQEVLSRGDEVLRSEGGSFRPLDAFIDPWRVSSRRVLFITRAERVENWDWLVPWFNKMKKSRIVIETEDAELAERLAKKANTRGLAINCESPSTPAAQNKLVSMITKWYPTYSTSQINYLLSKNDWKLDQCLELLNKVAMLNLPLNSDTVLMLGICSPPDEEFITALQDDQIVRALTLASNVKNADSAVRELSQWLDCLARVKFSQSFLKPDYEIALEVGLPVKQVEQLRRQAKKFDTMKINRAALALANAQRDLSSMPGVALEVLANSW